MEGEEGEIVFDISNEIMEPDDYDAIGIYRIDNYDRMINELNDELNKTLNSEETNKVIGVYINNSEFIAELEIYINNYDLKGLTEKIATCHSDVFECPSDFHTNFPSSYNEIQNMSNDRVIQLAASVCIDKAALDAIKTEAPKNSLVVPKFKISCPMISGKKRAGETMRESRTTRNHPISGIDVASDAYFKQNTGGSFNYDSKTHFSARYFANNHTVFLIASQEGTNIGKIAAHYDDVKDCFFEETERREFKTIIRNSKQHYNKRYELIEQSTRSTIAYCIIREQICKIFKRYNIICKEDASPVTLYNKIVAEYKNSKDYIELNKTLVEASGTTRAKIEGLNAKIDKIKETKQSILKQFDELKPKIQAAMNNFYEYEDIIEFLHNYRKRNYAMYTEFMDDIGILGVEQVELEGIVTHICEYSPNINKFSQQICKTSEFPIEDTPDSIIFHKLLMHDDRSKFNEFIQILDDNININNIIPNELKHKVGNILNKYVDVDSVNKIIRTKVSTIYNKYDDSTETFKISEEDSYAPVQRIAKHDDGVDVFGDSDGDGDGDGDGDDDSFDAFAGGKKKRKSNQKNKRVKNKTRRVRQTRRKKINRKYSKRTRKYSIRRR